MPAPFSPLRTNPYPLRAAVQLGCDNLVTGTAARIDSSVNALRDGLYHTEIPISQPRIIVRGAGGVDENNNNNSGVAFMEESSIHEATNALRKVIAGVRSVKAREVSLLLMPPFDRVENTTILAEHWSREFQCQVKLFKDIDFKKQAFMHMLQCKSQEGEEDGQQGDAAEGNNNNNNNNNNTMMTNYKEGQERLRLNKIRRKRQLEKMMRSDAGGENNKEIEIVDDDGGGRREFLSPQKTAENFEWCWFMSHMVAAKNMAPHRTLLIKETPLYMSSSTLDNESNNIEEELQNTSSLEIVGCDMISYPQQLKNNSNNNGHYDDQNSSNNNNPLPIDLLRWSLPPSYSIPNAHRILYEKIQRRPIEVYKGHLKQTVNPMTRSEVLQLVNYLIKMNNNSAKKSPSSPKATPDWIMNRLAQDCVVTGSSSNGGLLNTCSRIVGNVSISVEKLEQSNEFHYAGLSDTLLRQNYPFPTLVSVQAAVFAAICRGQLQSKCRRVAYLPEVSLTHAMLTHPDLWMSNQLASSNSKKLGGRGVVVPPRQSVNVYPKQAVDRFDPKRVRW